MSSTANTPSQANVPTEAERLQQEARLLAEQKASAEYTETGEFSSNIPISRDIVSVQNATMTEQAKSFARAAKVVDYDVDGNPVYAEFFRNIQLRRLGPYRVLGSM